MDFFSNSFLIKQNQSWFLETTFAFMNLEYVLRFV